LFSQEFAEWADRANIVAEFIRFNPLYSSSLLASVYRLELNRITVCVDLQDGFESLLAQASAPRQRNYRKALKSGLKFVRLTDYQLFTDMYKEAMHRLAAASYYYFSPQHFAALAALPEESRSFVGVEDKTGRLLATGVFLFDEVSAHYHLGAASDAGRESQPNAFMMLEAAKAAAQAGRLLLHLGGGLSLAEDDGLFRFKAGFSQKQQQFFIARRIHRLQLYQQISQAWQTATGQKPGILLHYHEGLHHADV
jgi:lipid II:glycine glycyltransferase (peptidoglycan interpeptide bridge formation enzyme)